MRPVIIVLLFLTTVLYSQEKPAYDFLKVDPSARSSALGGAFETYTDDPYSMMYNPAGLSTILYNRASATFGKYLLDINFGTAVYTMRYKELGWFGAAVRYLNYGDFENTNEYGEPLGGTFGANDLMFSVTYSNIVYDRLNFGVTAKYINSNIAEYSSNAVAMDFGFLYLIPSEQMALALSVNNLGQQISAFNDTKEKLPLDVRIGISKRLEHLPLKLSASLSNLNEEKEDFVGRLKNFSIGGEFAFSDNVAVRIGYNNEKRQDLKLGTTIGIAGFSAGLGIKFADKYQLDYSLNSFGKIGNTHRFSLGYSFLNK